MPKSGDPAENLTGLPVELHALTIGLQGDYIPLASDYLVARTSALEIIGREALLLQDMPRGEVSTHEVVAWRVDGVVTEINDERFDFASRARLCVTPKDARITPPSNVLLDEPLAVHELVPAALAKTARNLGKAGMYVVRMDYTTTPINEVTGPLPIARLNMTQLRHGGHTYEANPKTGEVTVFPHMPGFQTVISEAYARHCAEKAEDLSASAEMAERLRTAAEQDRKGTHPMPMDNRGAYSELLAHCPEDTEDRIKALAKALYAFESGHGTTTLPPDLAAFFMDPGITEVAELALLNKWSYMEQISGRQYTAPLTAQLRHIKEFGLQYHLQLSIAVSLDGIGFHEQVTAKMAAVEEIAREAKAFADHLSAPETLSVIGEDWQVRPR